MMRADLEAAKILRKKRADLRGDVTRNALCEPCYVKFIITPDRNALCTTCRPKLPESMEGTDA